MSGHKLVDYFVISGLNISSGLEPDQLSGENLHCAPLDRPYKAYILAHYPEQVNGNTFDADAVCMLSHPRGLGFRTQKDGGPREPRFHSFVITREDGSRFYGAALVFYERVDDEKICLAMQTLQVMHDAEMSNTQSLTLGRNPRRRTTTDISPNGSRYATAPRHSSLDSRCTAQGNIGNSQSRSSTSKSPRRSPRRRDNPSLSATDISQTVPHIYCRATDTLYCSRCITLISRIPLVHTLERVLLSFYYAVTSDKQSLVASALSNLLFDIPMPSPGTSLRITLLNGMHICQRPGCNELPLLDYPLRQLFLLLGVETVLAIVTGVLLERQILFYSKEFDRLMLVSECISTLIFPFHWQHVYVPILPASMLHFLDAPVPFIMGLQADDSKALLDSCSQANVWMVDIDVGEVEKSDDVPSFPFVDMLRQDLEQELRRHGNLSQFSAARQRDSGCVRDSVVSIGDTESTGSSWSLSAKMEMLQQNEVLAQVQALARKSGVVSSYEDICESVSDAAISRHRSGLASPSRSLDEHVRDLVFNSAIREIFLHYFVQVFGSYESFVIQPPGATDLDSWTANRETMQNFDKTAFLGDQREDHLQFMSSFIETQMFASFVDCKILSQWTDPDRNLAVFETRLKAQKDDSNSEQRFRRFYRTAAAKESESLIEKRASVVDVTAPTPKPAVEDSGFIYRTGHFPVLPVNMFNKMTAGSRSKSHDKWREKYGLQHRTPDQKKSFEQRNKYIEEINMKTSRPPVATDMNPKAMVNSNLKFNEALLKECKSRTKRMLVQKMGQEAVDLGHGDMTVVGVEENTLIASLCDLLERIWSHGLQQKQGKSPLWAHLLAYHVAEQKSRTAENTAQATDPNSLVTDSYVVDTSPPCSNGTQTWPMRGHRRKPSRGPELPILEPLPVSVLFDMRNVWKMSEIKTAFGYSRAFVRLALEKKLLSRHLKELLSNQELLRDQYRRYAFLRCEDEREQFLYHLLSLNAVDYYCFTKTFTTTMIHYRVLVFPRLKSSGGSTTANCWFSIAGQFGETDQIQLPKHTLDITLHNKNLGILTTMRIGHDNCGISPKWMVEHVLVRNEVTGYLYRFPCGRWLGRGVDDGALERLLVAEPVPPSVDANELLERCRTPPRTRSPSITRRSTEPRPQSGEIQERLCDAVNSLVKHFCKPEKERGSLTGLLCGEYGLVFCMEQVFQYGFKSSRLFRNRFFIWDFLEKVLAYLETLLGDTENYDIAPEISTTMQSLCYVITCINQASESIGKDGRFQLFICIGVRDRLLPRWIKIISKTRVTVNMYEEQSFLRDPALIQFVFQILDSLKDFEFVLEASLIRGVNL